MATITAGIIIPANHNIHFEPSDSVIYKKLFYYSWLMWFQMIYENYVYDEY